MDDNHVLVHVLWKKDDNRIGTTYFHCNGYNISEVIVTE